MRGGSLVFVLLIPAFVALGHDIYLFYINFAQSQSLTLDLVMKEFKFSDLGFIWTTYDEASYKSIFDTTDPETWAWIEYVLTFSAVVAGLTFAGGVTFLCAVPALFGRGPFSSGEGGGGSGWRLLSKKNGAAQTSFRAGENKNAIDFKRK